MLSVQSAFSDLLHLFFPHICAGCGSDIIADDQQLCLRCLTELPATNFFDLPGNPVEKEFYGRLAIRNAAAGYFFTKDSLLQSLVFQLKYQGNQQIGFYLGALLGKMLSKSERFSNVDALIPLPLNRKKERKRGYNQATILCKGIETVWKKPVIEDAVKRKRFTETQTQKGRISRWENMEGVFTLLKSEQLQSKHVLLVDDVVTTGATLEACGAEILKIPGTTLSIATLAYTI